MIYNDCVFYFILTINLFIFFSGSNKKGFESLSSYYIVGNSRRFSAMPTNIKFKNMLN